MTSNYQHTC